MPTDGHCRLVRGAVDLAEKRDGLLSGDSGSTRHLRPAAGVPRFKAT